MSDFNKAVLAGIQSAKDADRDTREIFDAIQELAAAVEQVSDGAVTVVHDRVTADPHSLIPSVGMVLGIAMGAKWLTSINLKRQIEPLSKTEIARIDIPSTGYPCDVMYGSKKLSCYDRASLGGVLEGLLSSPDVGRALLRLINAKPVELKPEEGTS